MKVERSIAATLCYADVFAYALTLEQLYGRLITPTKVPLKLVRNKAAELVKKRRLSSVGRDYCLCGREEIVKLKYQSLSISKQKRLKAKTMVNRLKFIPSVLLIGLSGNLAMNNAKASDDTDLFIVCQQNKLWTTRLLSILMTELFVQRRRPQETRIADKICLNMFVDEDHLIVPVEERDLFSAYEVTQMKPLFDRGGVYKRFCRQNQWVLKYLANAWDNEANQPKKEKRAGKIESDGLLEKWLGRWQRRFMQKRRTNEIIKHGYVRFHPNDARKWILKKYRKNLEKLSN